MTDVVNIKHHDHFLDAAWFLLAAKRESSTSGGIIGGLFGSGYSAEDEEEHEYEVHRASMASRL
jgi:hypothetical protein